MAEPDLSLSRELVILNDGLVDCERERQLELEREHSHGGVLVAVRPRANGERDGERATAASDDRRRPCVHHVSFIQGPEARAEDQHGGQHGQHGPRG